MRHEPSQAPAATKLGLSGSLVALTLFAFRWRDASQEGICRSRLTKSCPILTLPSHVISNTFSSHSQYYCRFGRTSGSGDEEEALDNANFAKFTRECPGLLDKSLNPREVDLIFVKVKSRAKCVISARECALPFFARVPRAVCSLYCYLDGSLPSLLADAA